MRTARACPRPCRGRRFLSPGGRGWRGRSACRTLRGAVFLCLPVERNGEENGAGTKSYEGGDVMRRAKWPKYSVLFIVLGVTLLTAHGAQRITHGGDRLGDLPPVYPEKAGTKLDNCNSCHSGGSYTQGTKTVTLGSCQWCHYKYGYDASGNIDDTLNAYGLAYKQAGRSTAGVIAIEKRKTPTATGTRTRLKSPRIGTQEMQPTIRQRYPPRTRFTRGHN